MTADLVVQVKNKNMNLIIPMAGKGTRLRPQTLTTPKPLINIAGRILVERIVDVILKKSPKSIDKIGFIIEKRDKKIEETLKQVASYFSTTFHVFYQGDPEGTAHAIYAARTLLKGPTLIVFSDTLFEAELDFDFNCDGCVFVKEVDNPSSYGVVKTNKNGQIIEFVEKPKKLISNMAIVGIYYFKEGEDLLEEIKYILNNKILIKGEYQLTTALENLKNKNHIFITHKIKSWLDFGTPKNLLKSHAEILKTQSLETQSFPNTTIHPPCYIASDVKIENSIIGPNVSVGEGTTIMDSKIQNTIIQSHTHIKSADLKMSLIGSFVEYEKKHQHVNIGDYSKLK